MPKAIPEFCASSIPIVDPMIGMRDVRRESTSKLLAKEVINEADATVIRTVK